MVTRNPLALPIRIVYHKRIRPVQNSTSCHSSDCPNSAAVVDSHADITSAVAMAMAFALGILLVGMGDCHDLEIYTYFHFCRRFVGIGCIAVIRDQSCRL